MARPGGSARTRRAQPSQGDSPPFIPPKAQTGDLTVWRWQSWDGSLQWAWAQDNHISCPPAGRVEVPCSRAPSDDGPPGWAVSYFHPSLLLGPLSRPAEPCPRWVRHRPQQRMGPSESQPVGLTHFSSLGQTHFHVSVSCERHVFRSVCSGDNQMK